MLPQNMPKFLYFLGFIYTIPKHQIPEQIGCTQHPPEHDRELGQYPYPPPKLNFARVQKRGLEILRGGGMFFIDIFYIHNILIIYV